MSAENENKSDSGAESHIGDGAPLAGVTAELAVYIDGYLKRTSKNLARVDHLISLSEKMFPAEIPGKLQVYSQDLLRAAVVFLHATLEDFLRYVGLLYLPHASEEALNHVALVGCADVLRPEKFFLGKLAQHRGKSVDEIITASVAAQLDRTSFSDVADIVRLLESIGIKSESCKGHFAALSELTTRRHRIVHRADLVDETAGGQREVSSISSEEVTQWTKAVTAFISIIAANKIHSQFGPRIILEKQRT